MDIVITLQWQVRIEGDRASAEEIVQAVEQRLEEAKNAVSQKVLKAYQEQIIQTLCSASGRSAPQGLGRHSVKTQPQRACGARSFRRAGQFISDGELAIERWLGSLGRRCGRCLWHLQRDSRYVLWADHAGGEDRRQIRRRLQEIVDLEPAVRAGAPIRPRDRQRLRRQLAAAHQNLRGLREERSVKGYVQTAGYLTRAQDKLFSHLELWLATGRLGLKTTSWIESMMRPLAQRLKKVGWNWSDAGAAQMGRLVLWRQYVPAEWQQYWHSRTNPPGRCRIRLVTCQREAA